MFDLVQERTEFSVMQLFVQAKAKLDLASRVQSPAVVRNISAGRNVVATSGLLTVVIVRTGMKGQVKIQPIHSTTRLLVPGAPSVDNICAAASNTYVDALAFRHKVHAAADNRCSGCFCDI